MYGGKRREEAGYKGKKGNIRLMEEGRERGKRKGVRNRKRGKAWGKKGREQG